MNDKVLFFVIFCAIVVIIVLLWSMYSPSDNRYDYCDFDSFAGIIDQSDYFGSLNSMDLRKRKVKSADSYKVKYKESFCRFTVIELARLNTLTHRALKIMPVGLTSKVKWSYAKIGVDLEMGLPHTLGNSSSGIIICICSVPLAILPDLELLEIICHEIAHVYQRLWESDYIRLVESLGFFNYTINADFLYGYYVKAANPDTWGYWVYNGCVLLSVYTGDELENTDATYNLATGKTILGGLDMGCKLVQQDHPFEIVAASIAKIAIGKGDHIRPNWLRIYNKFDY